MTLIWLLCCPQYNLCINFPTSSSAIYSRLVPLGDSNEYFDQIWFPSQPPGVAAVRSTVRCKRATPGIRQISPKSNRPWPADNLESRRFQRSQSFLPRLWSTLCGPVGTESHLQQRANQTFGEEILLLSSLTAAVSLLWCHEDALPPLSDNGSLCSVAHDNVYGLHSSCKSLGRISVSLVTVNRLSAGLWIPIILLCNKLLYSYKYRANLYQSV